MPWSYSCPFFDFSSEIVLGNYQVRIFLKLEVSHFNAKKITRDPLVYSSKMIKRTLELREASWCPFMPLILRSHLFATRYELNTVHSLDLSDLSLTLLSQTRYAYVVKFLSANCDRFSWAVIISCLIKFWK